MSHSRGVGSSGCVRAEGTSFPGSKRGKGDTNVKNSSDQDSSASTALNCCLDGTVEEDIDIDERIRSALNEPESPKRSFSTNGARKTRTTPSEPDAAGGGVSEESNSDSEGEEMCPNAMGYMPLPQDPDAELEDDDACDWLASDIGHCDLDVQEGIQDMHTQDKLVEDVVSDAIPTATSVDLKKGIYALFGIGILLPRDTIATACGHEKVYISRGESAWSLVC